MLEAGAGTGGLTKDALPLFETDMHHELLRYCATDITSAFSAGLIDAVRSQKLIFKVPRPLQTLLSCRQSVFCPQDSQGNSQDVHSHPRSDYFSPALICQHQALR